MSFDWHSLDGNMIAADEHYDKKAQQLAKSQNLPRCDDCGEDLVKDDGDDEYYCPLCDCA